MAIEFAFSSGSRGGDPLLQNAGLFRIADGRDNSSVAKLPWRRLSHWDTERPWQVGEAGFARGGFGGGERRKKPGFAPGIGIPVE